MKTGPILCVDDEAINLGLIRATLSGTYDLVFARNGEEALAAAYKHRPSLILLDIQMPRLSGLEVCRLLKADPCLADIPVIFVTSMCETGDEQAGFDAGGVDYITKPFSLPLVRARVATHLRLVRATRLDASYRDAVHMLGEAGHYNDTDTGVHIWRMGAYCGILARRLGWNDERSALLELAAPMHDTGKIGIPDAILRKPASLTAAEWEIMKTHSAIGHDILRRSDAPVFQLAAEIALNHHEHWDGGGYPLGLKHDEIPIPARMVAVADVFDALTMKRPYKPAWPVDRAIQELQTLAGKHLDPSCVTAFTEILPQVLDTKSHWDHREHAAEAAFERVLDPVKVEVRAIVDAPLPPSRSESVQALAL
jgi:putative two-component system response regulator